MFCNQMNVLLKTIGVKRQLLLPDFINTIQNIFKYQHVITGCKSCQLLSFW